MRPLSLEMPALVTERPPSFAPTFEGGRRTVAFVDDASLAVLRAGLTTVAEELDLRRGNLRNAIRYFEKESGSGAVIVDVEGIEDPQGELDDLARVCPPDVKVFVIGDNNEIGFYRSLVNDLGVTDYLAKPLTRDAVQRLILPRVIQGSNDAVDARPRGGAVIAVCGLRGGVGATTIAVSTALELAALSKGHVALLDLHIQNGTAALMVSQTAGQGLRIALADPDRADALFLERTAIEIGPRARLIANEETLGAPVTVTEAGLERVLDLLRRRFNFIVIDLPFPVPQPMQGVLTQARSVVAVLGPDLASVRDLGSFRHALGGSTDADRLITVLNRATVKGALPRELVAKGLGGPPAISIPDLGRSMIEALNMGVPAVQRVPALRKHLGPLIRELAGVKTNASPTLLSRIWRR